MPSFYDPGRRQVLLDRLARLDPQRPPRWGRMTAPQMVGHLIESMRMAAGEIRPRPRPIPLQRLLRGFVIHRMPWPKGAPTAPELLAHVPAAWEADLARLRDAISAHVEPAEGASLPDHPAFGTMSKRDWGVLLYRHIDHHLTQFGC